MVNHAGFASVAPLLDADIQKTEDMIALNVTALTRLRASGMHPLSASSAEIPAGIL
jgi:short-subunit dehydrogenase